MLWMWDVLKRFDYKTVVGHKLICDTLQKAVATGKTVSAYLISGPSGIGKKTLSMPFAASLLCQAPESGKACLSCPSCKLLAADSHPDLFWIRVPKDKKSIGVDQVREEILKEAFVRPFTSKRKVFIIEDGAALTAEAQNALLKALEEPPAYVCFIILAENKNEMLETVRSRSLKLQLLPLSASDCRNYFAGMTEGEASRRAFAATFSQGILGNGKRMLTDEGFYSLYNETVDKLVALLRNKKALVDMQAFLVERKESIQDVIDFMLLFFRDCMRSGTSHSFRPICLGREADIAACGALCGAGGFVRMMEHVIRFRERLQKNASFAAAGLELLTQIQEEVHDQSNRCPI